MFCKLLMLSLLSSLTALLLLQTLTSPATAQRDLGFIVESPETAVVPLGSIANFSCTVVGNVFWDVNGFQIQDEDDVNEFAASTIFVPLSSPNHSVVMVITTAINNGSNITCLVEREGDFRILNRSNVARVIAYGEPSPPSELNVTVLNHGRGVWLTWKNGFSFQGEDVKFVILSQEIASGLQTETRTNLTSIVLSFAPFEDRCLLYNFTIFAENSFSRSSSVVTESALLPAVPTALERVDVIVSFEVASTAVEVQFAFEAPSPCVKFSVDQYTVVFIDVTDSTISSTFNVSQHNSDSNVSLSFTASDGILLGRLYNFTMIAHNSVGSSAFVGSFYTTGLQSSRVVVDLFSASITCEFAAGALAVGCHVLFGSLVQYNISRDPESKIVMENVTFPEELRDSLLFETVAVSEILANGSVSPVFLQPTVTFISATTTTAAALMSTTVDIDTTVDVDTTVDIDTNSSLPRSSLYIIVGVIAAVILILLLVIIVVVCILRSSYQRNKSRRSIELSNLEELKPNYMYNNGAPAPRIAATDMVGLENTRKVRSNTYDDPRNDLPASNGAAAVPTIPTYETIQSAKNGMMTGGPPVLNPVYGPTGTPNTPTSPLPQSSKAASNPVYAESSIIPQQFSDVSALNPVYAPIGKQQPETTLAADQSDQRYAYAQVSCVSAPPSSVREQNNPTSPAVPMYEELRTATKLLPNCTGAAMTKNESYGMIGMDVAMPIEDEKGMSVKE